MKHVICGIDLADYQPGSININRVGMIEWGKYQSPRCLPSRSGSMYEFKTQPLAMTIETRESIGQTFGTLPGGYIALSERTSAWWSNLCPFCMILAAVA
jgi:hypothetical protein